MRNISFVIWVLGWPLFFQIKDFLNALTASVDITIKAQSTNEIDVTGLFFLTMWIWIGTLLYEKRPDGKS